jgi:hypothetical protein
MHGKERAIAPILLRELGLRVRVASGIDTDTLGTFTGETARIQNARETAMAKARLALEADPRASFGLGSEGSFGPHPVIPFATAGYEIVVLLSRKGELVLVGTDLTLQTNCAEAIVTSVDEGIEVAQRFGFPSHAALVTGVERGRASFTAGLVKGLQSTLALRAAITGAIERCGSAGIASDMRAHMNPTRMRAIERATVKLADSASARCPVCRHPGFDVSEHIPGLLCRDCGALTALTRYITSVCTRCAHHSEQPRPDGRTTAEPGECSACNP